jgi:hypothetical protein
MVSTHVRSQIFSAHQTGGKHGRDGEELGLEVLNDHLHAVVEDVEIGLVGHLQQIWIGGFICDDIVDAKYRRRDR